MERTPTFRICFGFLAGIFTTLAGCDTHPLRYGPDMANTYAGTKTSVVSPQGGSTSGGQTPTVNQTVTTVPIIPTDTAENISTSLPTDTNTYTATATSTATSRTVTATATATSRTVTFLNGQAQGGMTGWGWVAAGAKAQLFSPTCDRGSIMAGTPCTTAYVWNSPTALCLSANIPALPIMPMASDYNENWGVMIGVNARGPNEPIGVPFISINVSLSGQTLDMNLRLLLHVAGDPDETSYCAYRSGTGFPLSSFNTACWDNSGKSFSPAMASQVDKVMVQVASGSTAIWVKNLCLNSIQFN